MAAPFPARRSELVGTGLRLSRNLCGVDTGCVFVALSYRLGLFGWNCLPALTTGSDAAGNFALLDILRALDWVKENIHHFGGNGASITLCGFSDGGRLAAALAASPLSRRPASPQQAAALSGGWSLADPDTSAHQLAERFAPLAVEDGLFADPASSAGWLLTPGADVREWLCSARKGNRWPASRSLPRCAPPSLYADSGAYSLFDPFVPDARSAVPLLLLSSATEFSGLVRDDLRPASGPARAYAVRYGSALCRWSSTEAVAEALA